MASRGCTVRYYPFSKFLIVRSLTGSAYAATDVPQSAQ